MKRLRHFGLGIVLAAAMTGFGGGPAEATVIRGVAAVLQNTLGERNAQVDLGNALDQSGLSVGYASGTTDFDAYLSGNPSHTLAAQNNEWFAPDSVVTGIIDFDLGAVYAIDRVAIWNEDATGVSRLSIFTSNDSAFAASTLVGTFSLTDNPRDVDYFADVLSLLVTNARYVRFEVLGAYADPDNVIPPTASLGELAFSTSAVPEPATLALLATGLLVLGATRRRC